MPTSSLTVCVNGLQGPEEYRISVKSYTKIE